MIPNLLQTARVSRPEIPSEPVSSRKVVEFERLNALGKAVYAGGLIAAATGKAVTFLVDSAANLIDEAERAFQDGLGDEVEDATIIQEEERSRISPPR